jgi:hypothetical protein
LAVHNFLADVDHIAFGAGYYFGATVYLQEEQASFACYRIGYSKYGISRKLDSFHTRAWHWGKVSDHDPAVLTFG